MGARDQDGRCQILRSRSFARVAGLRHSRRHAHSTHTTPTTTPHAPHTPYTDIGTQAQTQTQIHRHPHPHTHTPTHPDTYTRRFAPSDWLPGRPQPIKTPRRPHLLRLGLRDGHWFQTITCSAPSLHAPPASLSSLVRHTPYCTYLPATCQLLPVSVLST
jgi:hypothetical protein